MMNKFRSAIIICICLAAASVVLALEAKHQVLKRQPTVNRAKWASVSLQFTPVGITASNGTLWICGAKETIAFSTDGGSSWHIQHQQQGGEILLGIAFVDKNIAHATGTGGLTLLTTDGGQTWSTNRADPNTTIKQFSFSDALNGIAQIDNEVDLTSDGGNRWQRVDVMQSDTSVRPFSDIESVASLNPKRFAIALHQPQGENIFLSTLDGGKTWTPTHVANTFAGTLAIHSGLYWAFGIEYLGREHNPGGGYSAPVTLFSSDAQNWQHGTRATTEFDGCTDQGCFLTYGVIQVLYGNSQQAWSLPQNLPLTSKWAIAEDKACMIRFGLYCGNALQSDVPQPAPDDAAPNMFQTPADQEFVQGCIDCQMDQITPDQVIAGRGAFLKNVTATFTVSADGSVQDISVVNLPSASMVDEIVRQISGWLIAPSHRGSAIIAATRQAKMNIVCFPGFPGHPATAGCNVQPASGDTQPSVMTMTEN